MKTKLFTLLLAVAASVGTMFAESGICGGNLTWVLQDSVLTISGTGDMWNWDGPDPYAIFDGEAAAPWVKVNSGWVINAYKEVVIQEGVTSIGDYAFNNHRLSVVTIPNSVTSIGNSAFSGCASLTSVTIPNSVTNIGESAFKGCSGLTSPVYNANVFAYMPTSYSGAYTIPEGIESIASTAFSGCTGLTSVTIPNSVTNIGESAFYKCTGLTSVTIPNSVTSIGDRAFGDCSGLTSVTIPNSVTSIGEDAFSGCASLPVIDNIRYADTYLIEAVDKTLSTYSIKEGTRWIGSSAFYDCTGLTSVTIPNSVTSIGNSAFSGCTGLTSIEIPNSVTSIGSYAFCECTGLTSVTIPNSVTSIGGWTFAYCSSLASIIWNAKNCLDFTSVNTPFHGLRYVNGGHVLLQFDIRANISFFVFGEEVEHIPANLCYGMTNLTSIMIDADTPPTLGIDALSNTNGCLIYVPCGTLDIYKTAWSKHASRIQYEPLEYNITGNVNNEAAGNVQIPQNKCEDVIAIPNYGYHFTQWSDGNTDNPRIAQITQDTTFTAEFAKNSYAISTISANPEWGTTAGDTTALYLEEVEISAIPNYGYHFVRWNDGNTSNPRTVTVTTNETFTATFAKDIYSITKNAEHGSISGNSSAEYLDFVTLTVTPDYGYHFTQWSDGLKDNPRIAQITQDTTFTAEFAYDRVGTCGKDLALVWSYDPNSKVLTIGNAGEFTENMQFGVEAPNGMEELVIGNSVTAIGANAFAGIETLKKIIIGESVKTIGEQAFYNCVNLETIFNYRPTPTNTFSNAFDGVDKFECVLYVLPSSIDMYKNAAVWRDFYYTYAIGAEETTVTTNDVTVEPQDNAATLTWPTSNNAASYTIQITKDGVVFCTLIFNANGQLTGIAFAPSRDGSRHAPQAIMTANGLQFTVTGLDSGTQYGYSVTAKDANDQTVATYSGSFTTTSEGIATGIDNTPFPSGEGRGEARKFLRDGQIFILRGEKVYNAQGALVK